MGITNLFYFLAQNHEEFDIDLNVANIPKALKFLHLICKHKDISLDDVYSKSPTELSKMIVEFLSDHYDLETDDYDRTASQLFDFLSKVFKVEDVKQINIFEALEKLSDVIQNINDKREADFLAQKATTSENTIKQSKPTKAEKKQPKKSLEKN